MADIDPKLLAKLQKRKKELKENSEGGSKFLLFFKGDETARLRILPPLVKTDEFGREIVFFYLGPKIKGVISPATFGEPCAIMEMYEELSKSKDPDDEALIKQLKPKQKFLIPVLKYADIKGKEVDKKIGIRLAQLTQGQYQDLIDYFLDTDEWGDFTKFIGGYDIKFTRTGKGQFDTEYSTQPCQKKPLAEEWRKRVDLNDMIRKAMPTYEKTKEIIDQFLGGSSTEDEDEDKPKTSTKKKKKKKPSSDL